MIPGPGKGKLLLFSFSFAPGLFPKPRVWREPDWEPMFPVPQYLLAVVFSWMCIISAAFGGKA